MSRSCVYLLACEELGQWSKCKIGLSKDPEKRVRQLQTGNPDRIVLVGQVPGGRKLEKAFHDMVDPFRLEGE